MTDTKRAQGTFEVQMTPAEAPDAAVGRMTLAKTFSGDLQGSSAGQMLSVVTKTRGSAAYVALEVVEATLEDRRGTFALQHRGTMNRGEPELTVRVVPDSGTGQLEGLTGQMTIDVDADGHHYALEYSLPPPT